MDEVVGERPGHAVGRETELAAVRELLEPGHAARALVLIGGPGIGKTTLWEAGIADARERRIRVLVARPSEAEARLAYAGLIDLLGEVDAEELAVLPAPQQHALEAALLRADPTESPPAQGAIGVGFLGVLRSLAARGPMLVAVDDVQWLDPASADALVYAARRLDDGARFLLAKRPGHTLPLEQALEQRGLEVLEVGPLSLGATRRMLSARLGLTVSRHVLRRVHESTLGNPLFALEVGRSLAEGGQPEFGGDIPVPEVVEDLLGLRVDVLPDAGRRALLAVALHADLRVSELTAILDPVALQEAVGAGLVIVDGERVRASHPLIAAAAKSRAPEPERREMHRALADVVTDAELRALHLALATVRPDEELSATVAEAALHAAARGAVEQAVVLAEHAVRLMPPGLPQRSERLLALADYLVLAGQKQRAADMLAPTLDRIPPGPVRTRALLILASGIIRNDSDLDRYFERALVESRGDPDLHATLLLRLAENTAMLRVARITEAEVRVEEALPAARRAGPELELLGLDALAWVRVLRGRPIDDVCERFRVVSDSTSYIVASPERAAGQRLAWRGQVRAARVILDRLQALADERGEVASYIALRLHLCELELRAGELGAASRLLDEWIESSEPELLIPTQHDRCHALLAALRGAPKEAERRAAATIVRAEAEGSQWDRLDALRARGVAALFSHDPAGAADSLGAVWRHTQREGVHDPGVFPVAPELVEALIELGDLHEAQATGDGLRGLAEAQEHPWGLVSARRCGALIRLAEPTYDEEAAAELSEAAAGYEGLGLRFDAARSLLSLGRTQRRHRKWGAARASLEQAATAFDELGSPGWADAARSELERVGGRRAPTTGELTPAERRVVELAVDGLSNKEIARSLVVAVPTVETHLSRAYAKLGVRSRAQLARRLSSG